jgi:hypothetical protein
MAVKKLLAMLVLAGFLCGTVVGCSNPTSAPAKPAEKPAPAKPDGEKAPEKP